MALKRCTTMRSANDHSDIFHLLRSGDPKSFEMIYDQYADRLYDFVWRRVRIKEVSEEIIQEIFFSLWCKRTTLEITISLDAYLFGAAKLSILAYMRTQRVRRSYAAHYAAFLVSEVAYNPTEEMMNLKDLEDRIDSHISELPERCQIAFRLSRIEHEPISSIAARMNISTGTVENYLTRALKHLRTSIHEFPMLLILCMVL